MIKFKRSSFKPSKYVAAILLMIANALFMSLLYVIVKILTKKYNFSSNQVGLLYKLTILMITMISCIGSGFLDHIKTKKLKFHMLRGFFSIVGSLSMFYAVSVLNVVDAAAISELTPAMMVLAGILIFNEQITSRKIILLFGSVLGAFFIVDFGKQGDINIGYFYAFLALISWSINNVIVKKLTKTEHSRTQLFYSSLFASIFAMPVAFFNFQFHSFDYQFNIIAMEWPDFSLISFSMILLAGVSSLLHKVSFFRAYKLADMSLVGPYDYLRLPFVAIFAYLFLDLKALNNYSLFGYVLIIASGVYFIIHEHKNIQNQEKKVSV